ncbi:MAG: arsenosugar biosynthesis radical SAM protein ArsS [Planctomycetaceae bacterium]|nr:arsenosugar biosynthesis radical SAM protein ArsS [Planctomycetaceae bacterium]
MSELTLLRQGSPLADPAEQVRFLEASEDVPPFSTKLGGRLHARGIETLQVNVGRVCNQTCGHCHVDAGPDRRESMSEEIAEAVLSLLSRAKIGTLDITGGAPEMNPQFRRLVTGARQLGCRVIDRCNLTILLAPGYEDLPEFLAENEVEIVASLPCYLEENVDRQRGDRVFQRSIQALQRMNQLGYGVSDSSLELSLVYNPVGPSRPPDQSKLEADYRRELQQRYGIQFTRLYTITNMPISRFLADLVARGRYEEYMQRLVETFNSSTIEGLMCRTMLSVDWQGFLYDCDFNQMLNLGVAGQGCGNVRDLDDEKLERLRTRPIVTGKHCYGCTAGAGSSCQGSLSTSDSIEGTP